MRINDMQFNAELADILTELISQLRANNIPYIGKQKETSTHIQIQCPYHGNGMERRPSAGIRKTDGVFHCFACGEVHSLQEVISHCFGHDDDVIGKWGWNWLLKNFATAEVEERKDVYLDFERHNRVDITSHGGNNLDWTNYNSKNRKLDREKTKEKEFITEAELEKYRYYHPYMYKRGLTDEIIEFFDIGYDKTTQCITFPIRDTLGNTIFVARRSVKSKFFNYPEGVEKPLYGLYELSKIAGWYGNKLSRISEDGNVYVELDWHEDVSEVIICESMLDALSFWVIGKYALALNGLGNDLQFKQLRELPVRKLILCTDMDEYGLKARERIRLNIQNTKIITEYILPKGRKDANQCTPEELKNLQEIF